MTYNTDTESTLTASIITTTVDREKKYDGMLIAKDDPSPVSRSPCIGDVIECVSSTDAISEFPSLAVMKVDPRILYGSPSLFDNTDPRTSIGVLDMITDDKKERNVATDSVPVLEFPCPLNEWDPARVLATRFLSQMIQDLAEDEWNDVINGFATINTSNLFSQLYNLFRLRMIWAREGCYGQLSIGYHGTSQKTLPSIREQGLRTDGELPLSSLADDWFVRSQYGLGVYTKNDPVHCHRYIRSGEHCVLVLRLLGNLSHPWQKGRGFEDGGTVWLSEEKCIILKNSAQCAVLGDFSSRRLSLDPGRLEKCQRLHTYFERLIDRLLVSQPHPVVRRPSKYDAKMHDFFVRYEAPQTLGLVYCSSCHVIEKLSHDSPKRHDSCAVCLEILGSDSISVFKPCGHSFHAECRDAIFEKQHKCPVCRFSFMEPRGTSPSGNLMVKFDEKMMCDGHPPGTIIFDYLMDWGCQKSYHINPSSCYFRSNHRAFIPDTPEGRTLAHRLIYAFKRGLTFTIAKSMHLMKSDYVVYASIPHKTYLSDGGVFGFPDPHFFRYCHAKLDKLGVPEYGDNLLRLPEMKLVHECFPPSLAPPPSSGAS